MKNCRDCNEFMRGNSDTDNVSKYCGNADTNKKWNLDSLFNPVCPNCDSTSISVWSYYGAFPATCFCNKYKKMFKHMKGSRDE